MTNVILSKPDIYFYTQKKCLEQRLNKIDLPKKEKKGIAKSKTISTLINKGLSTCIVGEVVNTVLTWNEEVDKELKEAKKEFLLSSYMNKTDDIEKTITKLTDFLTNVKGNTLFNKLLEILNNTPPDIELTTNLSTILNNFVYSDFNTLFEEQKYVLNLIEHLTPQALSLMTHYKDWKKWQLSQYTQVNGKLMSSWVSDFVSNYLKSKNINSKEMALKVSHSMEDLIKHRCVTEKLYQRQKFDPSKPIDVEIHLTEIGQMIYKYIV